LHGFDRTENVTLPLDTEQRLNKENIMYSSDIIEVEDFRFNHLIHHFDECDGEHMHYNEEYGCIEAATDLIEEILWN
jgi:hypothetical protein